MKTRQTAAQDDSSKSVRRVTIGATKCFVTRGEQMNRKIKLGACQLIALTIAAAVLLMPLRTFAQTQISYHKNRYKPSDDVKLGRQAAAEAEQQFPLLRDSEVTA